MPILFRDTTNAVVPTPPPWLAGCPDVQCILTDRGAIYSACDPLFLAPPPEAAWRPLVDGWQVALVGELDLSPYVRQRQDLEFISVSDSWGRAYLVPAVLTPGGAVALTLPWGLVNGSRARKPAEEQRLLIAAAEAARGEILAGKVGEIPIDVAADWVHALLASAYHLPPPAFDALEIVDDKLALRALLAASGFPVP